jgi:hypothetical protein
MWGALNRHCKSAAVGAQQSCARLCRRCTWRVCIAWCVAPSVACARGARAGNHASLTGRTPTHQGIAQCMAWHAAHAGLAAITAPASQRQPLQPRNSTPTLAHPQPHWQLEQSERDACTSAHARPQTPNTSQHGHAPAGSLPTAAHVLFKTTAPRAHPAASRATPATAAAARATWLLQRPHNSSSNVLPATAAALWRLP